MFAEYIDWRADHPSDDLMTDMLQAEFEDETGTVRRLTREEILTYVTVVAGAGNETTTRLIGWTGKVLAEHPDQRRELVEDRTLLPAAIEELLRFESPAPYVGRFMTRDVELHGRTVPAGSIMLFLNGAANHDDRRWPDPDRFDIHREIRPHITFGYGIHFCLGAALARLEGRIALDEVLDRFPEWTVDWDGARLAPTSTVRGLGADAGPYFLTDLRPTAPGARIAAVRPARAASPDASRGRRAARRRHGSGCRSPGRAAPPSAPPR